MGPSPGLLHADSSIPKQHSENPVKAIRPATRVPASGPHSVPHPGLPGLLNPVSTVLLSREVVSPLLKIDLDAFLWSLPLPTLLLLRKTWWQYPSTSGGDGFSVRLGIHTHKAVSQGRIIQIHDVGGGRIGQARRRQRKSLLFWFGWFWVWGFFFGGGVLFCFRKLQICYCRSRNMGAGGWRWVWSRQAGPWGPG